MTHPLSLLLHISAAESSNKNTIDSHKWNNFSTHRSNELNKYITLKMMSYTQEEVFCKIVVPFFSLWCCHQALNCVFFPLTIGKWQGHLGVKYWTNDNFDLMMCVEVNTVHPVECRNVQNVTAILPMWFESISCESVLWDCKYTEGVQKKEMHLIT